MNLRHLSKGCPNTGLPKNKYRRTFWKPDSKIIRASKTTLLRRATQFADTSAYGRGEGGARSQRRAPNIGFPKSIEELFGKRRSRRAERGGARIACRPQPAASDDERRGENRSGFPSPSQDLVSSARNKIREPTPGACQNCTFV